MKSVFITFFVTFALCFVGSTWAQPTKINCDAECKNTICGGKIARDSDGRLEGCTNNNGTCAGECFDCTGGAAAPICVHSPSKVCATGHNGVVGCGTRTKFPCNGTWPGCGCNRGVPATPTNEPCNIVKCN